MKPVWFMAGCLPAFFAVLVFLPCCSVQPQRNPYTYYRLDENLSEAITVDGAEPKGVEGVRLSFATKSAAEWTSLSGKGRIGVEGSCLKFSTDGPDCLRSPEGLDIETATTDSVEIRMKVSGADNVILYWPVPPGRDPVSYRTFRINVPRQGEMITYNLRLSALKSWSFTINCLLLSLPSAGQLELEYIQFKPGGAAFVEKAGLTRWTADNVIRPSLYNHCPGRFSYGIAVPDRAVFSAGLAVEKQVQPVTFTVMVGAGAESATLYSRTVVDPSKWEELEIDLAAYAGRQIELSLVTACDVPGQVALWGHPMVFQRRPDQAPRQGPPNVILYVVDSLRADHLEIGGYHRNTAPNIAAFARQAVTFNRCFTQDTWTKPSTVSIVTGTDYFRHGVQEFADLPPEGLEMLPNLLRQHGYEICAVSENPNTPPESTLPCIYSEVNQVSYRAARGSLRWHDLPPFTHDAIVSFLQRNLDKPFFLYVHTMEPHEAEFVKVVSEKPVYDPVEPFRSMWKSPEGQTQMDLYDGGIGFADSNFQRVLEAIDRLVLSENTIVILTADHGEAFGEHEGWARHNGKPYNELTHVPLLIRFPNGRFAGTAVSANVQLIDLAPTLFDLLGLGKHEQFDGRSLVPLASGDAGREFDQRPIYSVWPPVASVIRAEWKLMYDFISGKATLFNLKEDSGELTDRAITDKPIAEELLKELQAHSIKQHELYERLMKSQQERAVDIDPQVQEQLRSLGYLDQ